MSTYSASPERASNLQLKTTAEERAEVRRYLSSRVLTPWMNNITDAILDDLDMALAALADTRARLAKAEAKTARLIDELDALQPDTRPTEFGKVGGFDDDLDDDYEECPKCGDYLLIRGYVNSEDGFIRETLECLGCNYAITLALDGEGKRWDK